MKEEKRKMAARPGRKHPPLGRAVNGEPGRNRKRGRRGRLGKLAVSRTDRLGTRELLKKNAALKEEIINRRRLEEALGANEEKYPLVFASSNDLLFVHWLVGDEGLGERLDVHGVTWRVLHYAKD